MNLFNAYVFGVRLSFTSHSEKDDTTLSLGTKNLLPSFRTSQADSPMAHRIAQYYIEQKLKELKDRNLQIFSDLDDLSYLQGLPLLYYGPLSCP